ncbi:putative F420-dependent oxidoreductase [Mycolicibacterium moriokaense]|uniref:Putative F420-dependent oxidoreductase n=2 Tax=Mycolicibacterium moriokaense TaxID=39691 RepID=A0A318H934_9MYCO|nr:putative F420-dependent oxidoreductase [Mycolicibacterium moriokaense]
MGVRMSGYAEAARALDNAGFESVWVPEHLALPAGTPTTYPYTSDGRPPIPSGTPCYDPLVLLSFVACATTTVRLCTNVYLLPLHHPLRTARGAVTLDRLSGGRVTLGIGVGWLKDEFDWTGEDFSSRGRRTDEIITILRRLWTESTVTHESESYRFGPVEFQPKPAQRAGIPIEVGGISAAALRRAATLGDGWIDIGGDSPEDLARNVAAIDAMRAEAGRDGQFEVTVGGQWGVNLDTIRRAADAGATRVVAGPYTGTPLSGPDVATWADRFRDEVIAPFNEVNG